MFRISSVLSPLSRLAPAPGARARMTDETCRIDDRSYGYGVIDGEGRTVVVFHGWGLAHHAYRAPAEALAAQGYRVIVPDLPGFGASSDLPFIGISLGAYSRAMARFLEECDEIAGEPVHLVGHSFGGAVAAKLVHDSPQLVASVVLVSSVSGVTWHRGNEMDRLLTERPLWDWGVHLISEFPLGQFPIAALGVLRDLSHNVVWHLPNMGIVAQMIRRSDLRDELATISGHGMPVASVWAAGDRVVTRACFDDQCRALGIEGTIVEGNHAWPLASPASFARTVGGIIESMSPAETACPR
ncbi:MAG: alpha/beta fold hydrolase [Acidimicrobiales bacterium]